jgi:hypothetical protein
MAPTSGDYEAEANRLRSQMGQTVDELRTNLTPSRLASEAASRVGVSDLSWRGRLILRAHDTPVGRPLRGLTWLCGSWRRLASATKRAHMT